MASVFIFVLATFQIRGPVLIFIITVFFIITFFSLIAGFYTTLYNFL